MSDSSRCTASRVRPGAAVVVVVAGAAATGADALGVVRAAGSGLGNRGRQGRRCGGATRCAGGADEGADAADGAGRGGDVAARAAGVGGVRGTEVALAAAGVGAAVGLAASATSHRRAAAPTGGRTRPLIAHEAG
jgi:hypothetical protein